MIKAGESDGEERKKFHAWEYVISDTVAEGLRRVVTSIAESVDKNFPGQGVWVSGSFGTGKPHFLSFAGMLLRGESAAQGVQFLTLEDETGRVDVVVWPEAHERYRRILGKTAVLIVRDVVQQREGAVSVLATQVESLK